jgi:hypothetical protein
MTWVAILHTIHIVFAMFWVGSLLYTEIVLWPQMRLLGPGKLAEVQGPLRSVSVRMIVGVPNVGTVVFGYWRGVADGVLDRLDTPYGIMFIVAAVWGIAMLAWWLNFPPRDRKLGWKLYYSSFAVMVLLMVGLRFTA